MINTIVADVLVTQGGRASAAIVLNVRLPGIFQFQHSEGSANLHSYPLQIKTCPMLSLWIDYKMHITKVCLSQFYCTNVNTSDNGHARERGQYVDHFLCDTVVNVKISSMFV